MAQPIKRLQDVLGPTEFGEKVDLEDLLEQEITILAVHFREGNFGSYVAVQFENEKYSNTYFTTGAKAIMDKLTRVKDQLPVIARVVRRRGSNKRVYYDLE